MSEEQQSIPEAIDERITALETRIAVLELQMAKLYAGIKPVQQKEPTAVVQQQLEPK